MTLRAAEARYVEQARLAAFASRRAAQLWARVDPDNVNNWRFLAPQLETSIVAAQFRAASTADNYVAAALDEQGIDIASEAAVAPDAFVGRASDGRPLASLLDQPRIATLMALADGVDITRAMARGRAKVQTISATMVQDAGRSAVSVSMFSRPGVGYVRMVNAPCCSRCALLAGKFFRSNQGFARHPRCDCVHAPTTADHADTAGTDPDALVASGQVHGLSRADMDALSEGADLGQVVNARKGRSGMTTTQGRTRGRGRLTPDGIYARGLDRDGTLRLLRENGYLAGRNG